MPKKEATAFTKELGAKVTLGSLRTAVDKAMEYLTTDILPPHWDRDLLFGMDISEQDTDATESDVRNGRNLLMRQLVLLCCRVGVIIG